jgi:hypothetical protein
VTVTTFKSAGPMLLASGWQPFPADAAAKKPSISGWSLLCRPDGWMTDDELQELLESCGEDACSIAITPDLFVVDMDEERPVQVARLVALADRALGGTPLLRRGNPDRPPLRVYRQVVPGTIRTRHLYRLDLLGAGGAQIVAFGLRQSGRPYEWVGGASPLTMRPDDPAIPVVTVRQVASFAAEAVRIIGPRPACAGSSSRGGRPLPHLEPLMRLKQLIPLHGFQRAAAHVLSDVVEGERNATAFAVVASGIGRGLPDHEILDLFDQHFAGWGGVSPEQVASMLARLRAAEDADRSPTSLRMVGTQPRRARSGVRAS